jgi:signal peptidase I
MTDDQSVGDPARTPAGAAPEPSQDDRRDVRSEAEGTVPDENKAADPDGSESGDERRTDEDAGQSSGEDAKKQGSFWKELPILVGVALVLALVIKAFAVQAFYIPSASMQNTLQIGDRVLVSKIVYHMRDIERGDVVVFNGLDSWDPEVEVQEPSNPVSKAFAAIGRAFGVVPGEKDYIKRVMGVSGDRVKCCDAQGRVTVNDVPVDERSYLYTDPATGQQNRPSEKEFEFTVPEGRLWVMGDHREVSYDSRQHSGDVGGGSIPESRVIGRAFVIVWPIGRARVLPIPKTFEQPALAVANAALPATPLAAGLVGAVPLTWAGRRFRRRLRRRQAAA